MDTHGLSSIIVIHNIWWLQVVRCCMPQLPHCRRTLKWFRWCNYNIQLPCTLRIEHPSITTICTALPACHLSCMSNKLIFLIYETCPSGHLVAWCTHVCPYCGHTHSLGVYQSQCSPLLFLFPRCCKSRTGTPLPTARCSTQSSQRLASSSSAVINCGCGFQVLHAVSCWLFLSIFTLVQDGHVASATFSCLTLLQDSHVASAASLKCSTAVHTSSLVPKWLACGWCSFTRAQVVPTFQCCTWQQWANFQTFSVHLQVFKAWLLTMLPSSLHGQLLLSVLLWIYFC
jgi:hypothetical protein